MKRHLGCTRSQASCSSSNLATATEGSRVDPCRSAHAREETDGSLFCSSVLTPGMFHSPTVSGTSVLLLRLFLLLLLHFHHVESDSALEHLHREPRIDSNRDRREEEKQLLPETTLSHLISSLICCSWLAVSVCVHLRPWLRCQSVRRELITHIGQSGAESLIWILSLRTLLTVASFPCEI